MKIYNIFNWVVCDPSELCLIILETEKETHKEDKAVNQDSCISSIVCTTHAQHV